MDIVGIAIAAGRNDFRKDILLFAKPFRGVIFPTDDISSDWTSSDTRTLVPINPDAE
jgi:hypothetical protein